MKNKSKSTLILWHWCVSKTFNNSLSTGEKALIGSICLFLQCECSHRGLLQGDSHTTEHNWEEPAAPVQWSSPSLQSQRCCTWRECSFTASWVIQGKLKNKGMRLHHPSVVLRQWTRWALSTEGPLSSPPLDHAATRVKHVSSISAAPLETERLVDRGTKGRSKNLLPWGRGEWDVCLSWGSVCVYMYICMCTLMSVLNLG